MIDEQVAAVGVAVIGAALAIAQIEPTIQRWRDRGWAPPDDPLCACAWVVVELAGVPYKLCESRCPSRLAREGDRAAAIHEDAVRAFGA